jgi:sugar O-acyltransferase (sialic acid O-acetyltransferase NeuD family)
MTGVRHIIIGSGGHAGVLMVTLAALGRDVIGQTVATARESSTRSSPLVLGPDEVVLDYDPDAILLVNGIGSSRDTTRRKSIFESFRQRGYRFATIVHPAAFCEDRVDLDEGAQVMAGAVIQVASRIGANTIVNSGAVVDHDCSVGDHCHVASGAVIAGGVRIGAGTHIGAGATIIQGIEIGSDCLVAAGCVVIRSLPSASRVAGVPAREMSR